MSTKAKKPTGKVAQTITAVKNIAKRLTAGKTVKEKDPVKKEVLTKKSTAKKLSANRTPRKRSQPQISPHEIFCRKQARQSSDQIREAHQSKCPAR